MKKVILMATFALISMVSFAQQSVGTLLVRPKIGLNFADLTNMNTTPRAGVVLGAEAEYQLTDIVSASVGALYSVQGARVKNITLPAIPNNVNFRKATANFNYLNFPLLANVYVMENLNVSLGLQPSICIASGYENGPWVYKDAAKTLELSIPIGVSYTFENFVFDARYNFGITRATTLLDSKNSVFQFTVGYNFALE